MAVIHSAGKSLQDDFGIGDAFKPLLGWVRQAIADDLWIWFAEHKNDIVIEKRVFRLFTVKVKVRQLKGLFIILFGEADV